MKKILLINTERTAQEAGVVTTTGEYGLPTELYNIPNLKARLEALGPYEVRVVHHLDIAVTDCYAPDYIFLSGRFSDWDIDGLTEEYAKLIRLIRTTEIPVFGICAGHELIGLAFGARFGKMADKNGEHAFKAQTVVKHHPILAGLGEEFRCLDSHWEELKDIPEGFDLLTSTPACRIQMIAHKTRPIFGTQFHPELQTVTERDGDTLLRNFLRLY